MGIRKQTLKTISFLIAFFAKKEIITILAHPAILEYTLFAIEAFEFFLFVINRLKEHLESMP